MTSVEATSNLSLDEADSENESKNESNHEISSDDGSDIKKSDKSSGSKRPVPAAELDDDKKAERRAANRRSAFQSRQRRKILIDDLQRTVAALSKDNSDLRRAHDETRVQLEATLLENHQLRMQQQLTGMGAMANPTAALFGVQALQQAQAQAALLRGGNPALAHLFAAGGPPSGAGAGGAASVAQLASTAATEDKGEKKANESGVANEGHAPPKSTGQASSGIHGILNAASAVNGQTTPTLTGNAAALQHLLQQNPTLRNSTLAGLNADAAQLAGLKGLLDQLCGASASAAINNNASSGQSAGNVSDALRVMLQNKSKQ